MANLSHISSYHFISRQSRQQTSATSRRASGPVSVETRGFRDKIYIGERRKENRIYILKGQKRYLNFAFEKIHMYSNGVYNCKATM